MHRITPIRGVEQLIRILVTVALACSLIVAGGCGPDPSGSAVLSADEPLPNIVFVMIDTLRADRLGVLGYDRDLTPTMDAIAAEGVVFEQASAAAPWTQPSIASVFTGQYPEVHEAGDYRRAREQNAPGVPGLFTTGYIPGSCVLRCNS